MIEIRGDKKVLITPVSAEDLKDIHIGDIVWLDGDLMTCRDVAHRRLVEYGRELMGPQEMLDRAEVKNKWQLTPLKDFKSPRLTERMWRTAVVVLLTSLIYEYLIPGGRNPCFALIGAVYGVGSRFEEGFHNGINRLIGTFVGGILVIPFYMLYQKQPFGIPAFLWLAAGLCLVLWCNLALQADSAIQPGIVVYFVVLYTVGEERVVFYTLARILDTGIGVLISLLCYLLLPSKYDKEQGLSFRTMWKATKHAFQSYKDKNRLFREDEQKNFGMKNKK